eukprot:TRINITY_DN4778_c0_g1_i2.p1 TRINITY_DN4778_c0_g1~~TRINITY_DN4778_c0_g1_i2.p1  ORF type:complete len:125 (+),score=34.80 TRINITY_DN4778_c0_g1_i2:182-556(+)
MKLLEQIWDDTIGGPPPEKGLGKLRKSNTFHSTTMNPEGGNPVKSSEAIPIANAPKKLYLFRNQSMEGSPPSSPTSSSPSSTPRERENLWRSVFHPGSNSNTKYVGTQKHDKEDPKSPSVYDWF